MSHRDNAPEFGSVEYSERVMSVFAGWYLVNGRYDLFIRDVMDYILSLEEESPSPARMDEHMAKIRPILRRVIDIDCLIG